VKDNQRNQILNKELLTTKDASELIGVSLPSIINWADAGRFNSFRTPGGHRRIRKQDFVDFAVENGYLLFEDGGQVESEERKVILMDANREYIETLKAFLEVDSGLKVYICSNLFEAGVIVGRFAPAVFVFDQESIPMTPKLGMFVRETTNHGLHIVSLATEYPVPQRKQIDNYIYLNKSKSIREIAVSIKNLVMASVVVL
jgi:excisionase family DNA binding protein